MRVPAYRWSGALLLALLCGAAVGCNRTSGWWMNKTGRAYYRAGRYAVAQQEFQRAVADDPSNADYRYNVAASLERQGRLAEAEQVYRQALAIDPAHQPSYRGLASLLRTQGRDAEAANLLAAWAATQPYNPEAHVELAWWNRQSGDLAAAEEALRKALQERPNHPVALAELGRLYEQTGQTDRALSMYQRSLHANWLQPAVQQRVAALRTRMFGSPVSRGPVIAAQPQTFASIPAVAPAYTYGNPVRPEPGVVASQPADGFNADPAHTRR